MLRKDKLGITCDHCGIVMLQEFRYYSLDVFLLAVTNNILPTLPKPGDTCTFSFDFCQACIDKVKNAIKTHYKPTQITPMRAMPGGIYCDLTGVQMIGTYDLLYVIASDVSVKIPDIAVNDNRYIEFNMCSAVFERIKAQAIKLRTSEAQQWSAATK